MLVDMTDRPIPDPRSLPHASIDGDLLPFIDEGRIRKLAFVGGKLFGHDPAGHDTLANMLMAANTVARADGQAAAAGAAMVLNAYLDTMYAHLLLGRGGQR